MAAQRGQGTHTTSPSENVVGAGLERRPSGANVDQVEEQEATATGGADSLGTLCSQAFQLTSDGGSGQRRLPEEPCLRPRTYGAWRDG